MQTLALEQAVQGLEQATQVFVDGFKYVPVGHMHWPLDIIFGLVQAVHTDAEEH